MTAPRPGDVFNIDLDGTAITGRYVEVDAPHRLVIGWDHLETGAATSTQAEVEITLTPAGDATTVAVQFSGLSAEDATIHRTLWLDHLNRIADAVAAAEPGTLPGS